MNVNPDQTIESFQEKFKEKYPGLKIEFYKEKHVEKQGSPEKAQYASDCLLGDIGDFSSASELELSPDQTVSEVESAFEEKLGLHVQIFRRSNTLWLQTTATDDWTLETQNRKGLHSIQ